MERLTFEGKFCDIAQCRETPGGSFCEDGSCSQRKVWERLKAYEDAEEQRLITPVVHGRWIFNQEQWTWDCTNCKGWVGSGVSISRYKYCPNCGAKNGFG